MRTPRCVGRGGTNPAEAAIRIRVRDGAGEAPRDCHLKLSPSQQGQPHDSLMSPRGVDESRG